MDWCCVKLCMRDFLSFKYEPRTTVDMEETLEQEFLLVHSYLIWEVSESTHGIAQPHFL